MSKILLVDDDLTLLKYIGLLLESDGHQVTLANDSHEAKERFLATRFDIVITDIFLHGGDSLADIEGYKSGRRQPKVIAMSGGGRHKNYGYLDEARARGADAILEKPFETELLLETVRHCLDGPSD